MACRVAERAIAGGALLPEEGAIEDVRERGSLLGYAEASAVLAEVAYRGGELASAEAVAGVAAAVDPGRCRPTARLRRMV